MSSPPTDPTPPPPPTGKPGKVPAWMALSALGFEMAVTVLMLGAAGWAVDAWLATRPWGLLIGLLLGCVLGMVNLVRGALQAMDSPHPTPARRARSKK